MTQKVIFYFDMKLAETLNRTDVHIHFLENHNGNPSANLFLSSGLMDWIALIQKMSRSLINSCAAMARTFPDIGSAGTFDKWNLGTEKAGVWIEPVSFSNYVIFGKLLNSFFFKCHYWSCTPRSGLVRYCLLRIEGKGKEEAFALRFSRNPCYLH